MKILIPVDGSDQAIHAIQTASRMLDKSAARVSLLYVRVPAPPEVAWLPADDPETTNTILDRARKAATEAGLTVEKSDFTNHIDAADAICQYAQETDMEMIIMGSHGYHGLEKFLLGSVSEKVFRKSPIPVVVMKNTNNDRVEISHFEKANLHR